MGRHQEESIIMDHLMYKVYPGVILPPDAQIGEYVVLGVPPVGHQPGDLELRINSGAVIRSHSVIYAGNMIGTGLHVGHGVLIRELNQLGDGVSIGSHTVIEHHVRIGNRVRIHSNAFIPEFSILEDDTWIGPNVVFTNARYPMSPNAKRSLRGPHVCLGAKIGANATLLPGVIVGRNALIGSGTVVVRDVPDGKVVVGNPGRILKDVVDLSAYQAERLAGKGE